MNPLIIIFDIAKNIPLVLILIIAAIQDHKTEQAKNRLWLYAPIGLTITILECLLIPELTYLTIFSITIGVILSFALYMTGAWGGADTKALLTITATTPLTPLAAPMLTAAPILVLVVAALAALPATIINRQKATRFLPYILIGYITTLIL